MARARNIKPAFFQNEDLAALSPVTRLIFIASWTVADFKGCFEWRPIRLKVQLAPFDRVNLDTIFEQLRVAGFVRRYSVAGRDYVKINNFEKHQNPHKNERDAGSDIPDIDAPGAREKGSKVRSRRKICTTSAQKSVESEIKVKSKKNQDSQTADNQQLSGEKDGTKTEPLVLIPSNGFPQPDSLREGTASPPEPESRPEDQRRSHPAIVALHHVTGIYPPKEIWDEVIDRLGIDVDVGKLKQVFTKWRARGYSKTNYEGIIDWYHDGIPAERGKGNGTNRSNSRGAYPAKRTDQDVIAESADFYDKYPS